MEFVVCGFISIRASELMNASHVNDLPDMGHA